MSGIPLDDNDVISMEVGQNFAKTSTSKLKEIRQALIKDWLPGYGNWIADGIYCQVLQPGKGWQSGKIRLRMEFVPDEPPKPKTDISASNSSSQVQGVALDDFRSDLEI